MIKSDVKSDGPEGHINNDELKRLWARYSPLEIHRQTKIPMKEIYRRLKKEVEQPLVRKGR